MGDNITSIQQAISAVVSFRDERDWAQYHTLRHLASALSIEVAELQEALLWKSDAEIASMLENPDHREVVRDEVADVLIYALLLCHEADINPLKAIEEKLKKNEEKYPPHLARGRSDKYTDL